MALRITKKDRESPQELVHRFTKTVRQSGILLQVKSKQFRKRLKSSLAKKRSAIRRVEVIAEKRKEAKFSKPRQ